jgi:hypothetical protein
VTAAKGQDGAAALQGFSASTLELQRIESQAERTIVQEIRLFERHVHQMLPALRGDDLAYAQCLLLKLDRLAAEQLVVRAPPTQHRMSCTSDLQHQLAA